MNRFLLIAALIFVATIHLCGQIAPDIQWQKAYGGTSFEYSADMILTSDGGFIAAGYTLSTDGDITGNKGGYDYWVVKTDASGNLEWQKCYGGSNTDKAYGIVEITDGGYIVSGSTYSNDGDVTGFHGGEDIWIVKIDAVGNIEWQKCYGGSAYDLEGVVIQTQEGGYAVVGRSNSNDGDVSGNHGSYDYWIVKITSTGTLQWQKSYGSTAADFGNDIIQTIDGGFIITGEVQGIGGNVTGFHGGADAWTIKLDNEGDLVWQNSLGGSDGDSGHDLIATPDGGVALACLSYSNNGDVSGNHGLFDYWLVKLDSQGDLTWQKCLGGSLTEDPRGISIDAFNNFYTTGNSQSLDGDVTGNHGGSDIWLTKTDDSGNLIWQKSIGGTQHETGYSVVLDNEGSLVIFGNSFSQDGDIAGNHGASDYCLLKLFPECGVSTLADFGYSNSGLNYSFTDSSVNASAWLWNFGDGSTSTLQNPSHTFSDNGVYEVCLTTTDSCAADISCQIINTCGGYVTSEFTLQQNGLTFDFTDASASATTWLWDFGDGNSSTQQNPSHTYTDDGFYTICLTSSNDCSSDQSCTEVNTCGPISADFSYTILGLTVDFTNLSTGNIVSKNWYFGDGGTSLQSNPSHTYAAAGNYTVTLTVMSNCESKIATEKITVCITTQASYTYTLTGAWAEFTNTSVDGTSYLWDFDGGNTTTLKDPDYFFTSNGSYDVCLTSINVCNADTYCTTITAAAPYTPESCWVGLYNDGVNFDFSAWQAGVDSLNNVYVAGAGGYISGYYTKLTTIKYDPNGAVLWIQEFSSGTAGDAYSLQEMDADLSGNVYILFSRKSTGRWGLVKYNSSGQQQWVVYADPFTLEGMSQLALDEYGNIFIGGTNSDYVIKKYYPDSTLAWEQFYDFGYDDNDVLDIACGTDGKVYVSGICVSHSSGSQWDGVTVTYDSSGNNIDVTTDGGTTSSHHHVTAGYDGAAYILGTDSYYGDYPNFYVHKAGNGYDWSHYYPQPYDETYGDAITADSAGNVYVACRIYIEDPEETFTNHILKYDASGNLVWDKIVFGFHADEQFGFHDIRATATGDVYFTGNSKADNGGVNEYNIQTGKINTDGVVQWIIEYDQAGKEDYPHHLMLDGLDNLFVIGESENSKDEFSMLTIKYCESCLNFSVSLNLAEDTICLSAPPFALSGGIPAGGIYTGNGITNNILDPLAAGPGIHDIVYTYDDGQGCIATDTQNVLIDICTAVQFEDSDLKFEVFPNPFHDVCNIHFSLAKNSDVKIELFDLSGRKIKTIAEGNFDAGIFQFELEDKNLAKGIYFIQIKTDQGNVMRKIICQ